MALDRIGRQRPPILPAASPRPARASEPIRIALATDTPKRFAAANVLDRQFEVTAPNQKWVADFTYIWTAEGWLCVAAVIDLFSRRVVGWSMSAAMAAQLVTDALVMAIWRRGKPAPLLHHSDRGSQYTSKPFQKLMADHGVTCSMSRSGNVGYIERFYNPQRRHSTLGYVSLMEYERKAASA